MYNIKKKSILILITLILSLIVFAACSDSKPDENKKTNAPTATASATASDATATDSNNETATPTEAPTPTDVPTVPPTEKPTATAAPHKDEDLNQVSIDNLSVDEYSSSCEEWGWGAEHIIDGDHSDATMGWTTQPGSYEEESWIVININNVTEIARIVLWPRQGAETDQERGLYFPISYIIEVSEDGSKWTTVAEMENDNGSDDNDTSPRTIDIHPIACKYIRITGTELSDFNPVHADGPLMQLSEVELFTLKK